jgi:pyrroline-5-carboxylate reductase
LDKQDCYILAVKPKNIAAVIQEIASKIPKNRPLVSLAAGITLPQLQNLLPGHPLIIRAMPNIAGIIGESATVILAKQQPQMIHDLFCDLGTVNWVNDDKTLDLATILIGSGPAYVFSLMQAFQQAIEKLGMPSELSQPLVEQTFLGAVRLSQDSSLSLTELTAKVTSPQGTTAAALAVLAENDIDKSIFQALSAAWQRIEELRRLLD